MDQPTAPPIPQPSSLAPLQLSVDDMRALGHATVDAIVEHYGAIAQKAVWRSSARGDLESRLREPAPENGRPPADVLRRVLEDVMGDIALTSHPRFFAFVPGPANFVGVMADVLAAGFNVFAGHWHVGAAAAEIELVTIEWLRQGVRPPGRRRGPVRQRRFGGQPDRALDGGGSPRRRPDE